MGKECRIINKKKKKKKIAICTRCSSIQYNREENTDMVVNHNVVSSQGS